MGSERDFGSGKDLGFEEVIYSLSPELNSDMNKTMVERSSEVGSYICRAWLQIKRQTVPVLVNASELTEFKMPTMSL
jgi:hypothetical protein